MIYLADILKADNHNMKDDEDKLVENLLTALFGFAQTTASATAQVFY